MNNCVKLYGKLRGNKCENYVQIFRGKHPLSDFFTNKSPFSHLSPHLLNNFLHNHFSNFISVKSNLFTLST